MTRINFRRSGGALGKKIETDIDLNELSEAESGELTEMLAQAHFFRIPQNLISQIGPDEYEYTGTVEAGNTRHTVHASEATAPQSLRLLLEKLSALARASGSQAEE